MIRLNHPTNAGRFLPPRRLRIRGMTLIELSVVILVLLSLITILFLGARAWKHSADRIFCLMNIRNVQIGVRSYSNLYGLNPGTNAPGLQAEIIGIGRFVETTPVCPSGGTYSYGDDSIPLIGTLYMKCSLGVSLEHVPPNSNDW
jgi:prepilin-type N-terminal cleavage/methylation domain-containing protein